MYHLFYYVIIDSKYEEFVNKAIDDINDIKPYDYIDITCLMDKYFKKLNNKTQLLFENDILQKCPNIKKNNNKYILYANDYNVYEEYLCIFFYFLLLVIGLYFS